MLLVVSSLTDCSSRSTKRERLKYENEAEKRKRRQWPSIKAVAGNELEECGPHSGPGGRRSDSAHGPIKISNLERAQMRASALERRVRLGVRPGGSKRGTSQSFERANSPIKTDGRKQASRGCLRRHWPAPLRRTEAATNAPRPMAGLHCVPSLRRRAPLLRKEGTCHKSMGSLERGITRT
jgi:hypothetical protein